MLEIAPTKQETQAARFIQVVNKLTDFATTKPTKTYLDTTVINVIKVLIN